MKDLFKYFEGLCRSVIVLVGSDRGLVVDLAGLRKKVLNTLSNFELKLLLCVFIKSLFQYSEGLVQII